MSLTNDRVFATVLIIIALIVGVWMFRYEITPVGVAGAPPIIAAYRLDRWT